jgi:hypothetical protein
MSDQDRIEKLEAELAELREKEQARPNAWTVVAVVLVIGLIIAGTLWFALRDRIDFGSEGGVEPGTYQGVSGDWCADAGGTFFGEFTPTICTVSETE